MDRLKHFKPAAWGFVAGGIVTMIIGFGWGGWTTGGSAGTSPRLPVWARHERAGAHAGEGRPRGHAACDRRVVAVRHGGAGRGRLHGR